MRSYIVIRNIRLIFNREFRGILDLLFRSYQNAPAVQSAVTIRAVSQIAIAIAVAAVAWRADLTCELHNNRPNVSTFPIVFRGNSAIAPDQSDFNRNLGDYDTAIRSFLLLSEWRSLLALSGDCSLSFLSFAVLSLCVPLRRLDGGFSPAIQSALQVR